jgi:uncharacterized protein with NAD-binding domain and iron-sulfur cluster
MPDPAVAADARRSHVVVIGGGWGGWGAAKALCEAGIAVTLIDGVSDPSGSTPITTASGKPFEAGTRGFWKDYPNINALTSELKLGSVFTDFTTSAFWSPDGLEATAPVFGASPQLPSPLGQMLATFSHFKRLPPWPGVGHLQPFQAVAGCRSAEHCRAACGHGGSLPQ